VIRQRILDQLKESDDDPIAGPANDAVLRFATFYAERFPDGPAPSAFVGEDGGGVIIIQNHQNKKRLTIRVSATGNRYDISRVFYGRPEPMVFIGKTVTTMGIEGLRSFLDWV